MTLFFFLTDGGSVLPLSLRLTACCILSVPGVCLYHFRSEIMHMCHPYACCLYLSPPLSPPAPPLVLALVPPHAAEVRTSSPGRK